jgi:pimeloyl-ACP methyl ester carboxylesterase
MHVDTTGPPEATPLAFLHGGTGTGRFHWGRVADALADRFRPYVADLPGHGRTPLPPDGRYDGDLLKAEVATLLERIGPPVHVLGFSMGGNACLALAADKPELFASMTLVGVSIRHHPGLDGWRERFDPDRLEAAFPLWTRRLSRLHEPLGGPGAWREVCVRDAAGVDLAVDAARLAPVGCPVLLVRGDRDPAVDPAQYAELRAAWDERADEFVVPAGGHEVQMTRHRLVTVAVEDFLRRIDA